MFIVERPGFRLGKGFYIFWFIIFFFITVLGAIGFTMHVHYDPNYWKIHAYVKPPRPVPQPYQASKLRRVFVVVAGILILGTLIAATIRAGMQPIVHSRDQEIEDAIKKMVVQIRPSLPRKLDDETTLVSIKQEGKAVIYGYQLN